MGLHDTIFSFLQKLQNRTPYLFSFRASGFVVVPVDEVLNTSPIKNHDKAAELHTTDTNRKYETALHSMILNSISNTNAITITYITIF
jgi:hypothetical protein